MQDRGYKVFDYSQVGYNFKFRLARLLMEGFVQLLLLCSQTVENTENTIYWCCFSMRCLLIRHTYCLQEHTTQVVSCLSSTVL